MKHSGIVHLKIGKNGITEGIITDITEKFKTNKELVIKMNQAFRDSNDRKQAAQDLAKQTNSTVSSLVGGTLILKRT